MTDSGMRVLLVDVPSVSPNQINLGLASVGAVLKQRGHEVRVLDLNNINVPGSRRARLRRALEWKPEVFAVSIFPACTYTYGQAERVLRAARRSLGKDCLFIVGGIGVSIDVPAALGRFGKLADILVHGEGEITLAEILERHAAGKDISGIPGTGCISDKTEIINPERPLVENLDSLPFSDYHIFDSVGGTLDEYPIMTSRGCPFNCIFCLNKTLTKRRFRFRSARNVVDEMFQAKDEYKPSAIYIWDDHFSLRRDRAEEICRLMIEEGLGLPYYLPDGIRADSVTPDFARLLKESGCAGVSIGFEDANPETFVHIKKGEKYDDIITAIRTLKDAGMLVRASMVIGLPHTSYRSTKIAMENMAKLGIHAEWYLATPFPGTEFYDWVLKHGRLLDDPLGLRALTFRRVVFDTPEFRRPERYKAFYKAFAHYSFPELAFYGKICNPLTQQRHRFDKYVVSIFAVARYIPERLPSHLKNLALDLMKAVYRRALKFVGKVFR